MKSLDKTKRAVEGVLDKWKRSVETVQINIHGLRVEGFDHEPIFDEDGVVELLEDSKAKFRLFGEGLSGNVHLAFTTIADARGRICEFPSSEIFQVSSMYFGYGTVKSEKEVALNFSLRVFN